MTTYLIHDTCDRGFTVGSNISLVVSTATQRRIGMIYDVYHAGNHRLMHHSSNNPFLCDTHPCLRCILLPPESLTGIQKKNVMPSAPVHYNTKIWGPDAKSFDARRFLKPNEVAAGRGAFKAWGGGATIRPGRHFATAEVTGILAMMVARFDIEPTAGKWLWPKLDWERVASSISPPKGDNSVNIKARVGLEGTQWAYSYGEMARKAEEARAEKIS